MQRLHELLRRPPRVPVAPLGKAHRFGVQVRVRYAIAFGEVADDLQVAPLRRVGKGDHQPEAVGEGQPSVLRVPGMRVVAVRFGPFGEAFADEVTAVAGGVDERVVWSATERALEAARKSGMPRAETWCADWFPVKT